MTILIKIGLLSAIVTVLLAMFFAGAKDKEGDE